MCLSCWFHRFILPELGGSILPLRGPLNMGGSSGSWTGIDRGGLPVATEESNPFVEEAYQAFAKDYLKEVLTNMREADSQLRRSVAVVITLAFVYVLAHTSTGSSVTVFSLRLENLSPLLAVIPIVTAYEYWNISSIVADLAQYESKMDSLIGAVYPRLLKGKWDTSLYPVNSVLFGPAATYEGSQGDWMMVIRVVTISLAPGLIAIAEVVAYGIHLGSIALSLTLTVIAATILLALGTVVLARNLK